ncbi:MAG: RNA polymerase sigma factor [Alphaproteobacteria bacterium]|nr:RNA polymerase sigma factor [Alphaproteobacteria bacterium]
MHAPEPTMSARIARLEGEILGFLRRRVGAEAEEVAQDVWLKVATADPDCADDEAFRAFVYVVARRALIDRYRRRRVELVPLDGGLEPGAPPDAHSALAAADIAAVVERTLRSLKPEIAEVFWLRTRDDVAFREIARRQGCSVNTALGRMHQVVKRLKKALAAEGIR